MAGAGQLSTLNTQQSTADIIGILRKWGIHTLEELAALNKEELRDRLGAEAVRLWERATGTATRLLKLVQPPESFDESFEFDHEIETAEPLLFILRRFLEQLSLRLSSIYLVARELTLRITFSNKGNYERVFKIPQPTNDVDLLFRMLQTHLENFKSEHPIVAVRLSAEPIRPVSQQFGLFETTLRNPQQLYETLARLTALLGSDRVGTPVLEETHRPDAFRMEAFVWCAADTAASTPKKRASPRCEPHGPLTDTDNRPYLNAGGTPATTEKRSRNDECRISNVEGNRKHQNAGGTPATTSRIALRRFRPPARTSIFILEGRYLGGEAGDWGQSFLPECRRDACHHRRSDEIRGEIVDQVGPFLLSGNWWDEKAWARAEWDMKLENREIVRAHEASGVWKLDGIYD